MALVTFPYKSPEELEQDQSWKNLKPGLVDFIILETAVETKDGYSIVTKDGKPGFQLKLLVTDSEGNKGQVFDTIYLHVQWRLYSLFKAVGLADYYKETNGEFNTDILESNGGKCVIELNEYIDRKGKTQKNFKVESYCEPDDYVSNGKPLPKVDTDSFNDDINF